MINQHDEINNCEVNKVVVDAFLSGKVPRKSESNLNFKDCLSADTTDAVQMHEKATRGSFEGKDFKPRPYIFRT